MQVKKSIVILIALWGRPDVFKICASNLLHFISKAQHDIKVVTVLSPEDPFVDPLFKVVTKSGFIPVYRENNPVSCKHNAGIEFCYHNLKFDYLMNFGSDDLIHPDIFNLYQMPMEREWKLFGINSLYFHDLLTNETIHFSDYHYNKSIGAGRMISHQLINYFMKNNIKVYQPGVNRSLDGNSSTRILGLAGVRDKVIDSGRFPYIVDIKNKTNINDFQSLKKMTGKIFYVKKDVITRHYPHVLL